MRTLEAVWFQPHFSSLASSCRGNLGTNGSLLEIGIVRNGNQGVGTCKIVRGVRPQLSPMSIVSLVETSVPLQASQ